MNQKNYLTPNLIEYILKKAADPIWEMPILSAFTNHWYDVMVVSQFGLIHFSGNADTGWEHIRNRHNLYSDRNYFGKGAIGNPSKFSSKSIPIHDFVRVSDDVFRNGVKDIKEHPDSVIFEKYKGSSNRYSGSDGTPVDFFLVFYKGTRIVHSVYPVKSMDERSPKRILGDFARCKTEIKSTKRLVDDWYTIEIPYENRRGVIRYVIILRLQEKTNIARFYIQVNNLQGVPLYTHFKYEIIQEKINLTGHPNNDNTVLQKLLLGLQYQEMNDLEMTIKEMEKFHQSQISSAEE